MKDKTNFDVIIIGGSYAGLSAAMALGRSLRTVLIIDSGLPCNRQTPHSHNFITHDGEKPGVIAEKAKRQVLQYDTVRFHNGLAVNGRRTENGFVVTTQEKEEFTGSKLIFATGIKDILPAIKGLSACWGISVIHCPYCHGYEFRHKRTAILSNGEKAFHLASLVNNLTADRTILTSGKAGFTDEQILKLNQHHIPIIEKEVTEIVHENGYVKNVIFKDGRKMRFDAVYASVPFEQHSDMPAALGCALTEHGHIRVDGFHKTSEDGIYACGDCTSPMRSVSYAVATGNITGSMVNKALTDEQF